MTYKMVAIDMDDTLLNDELRISKENQEAIKKASKKGVKIVLCSGRTSLSINSYLEELGLKKEDEYGISYNGAVIFKTKDLEIINQEDVSLEYAQYLFVFAKKENVYVQTYQGNDLLVEKSNEYTKRYTAMAGIQAIEIGDFSTGIKEDVIKVLFQDDHEKLVRVAEKIRPWTEGKLHMFFSKPYYLEFTSINANKGLAVRKLGQKLGFKKEEIICVGDSFNDLYMIKEAGLGIAMANAHPDIKKAAQYITENDNNHHAIKEVIEKFIL
ncbi:Cof-type HAD-IIB family hydrolase [Defluviitalea saccharophila]|uniref:Cof-type HAD-IIB family hydrolase n=1 Tax=Defluviitalea saccharophila TaxID=879970 RepID=A0ABZ2Y141_9FIRM|nr:HAD family phosphatase [Candidatus Epulonipiscium sp.]